MEIPNTPNFAVIDDSDPRACLQGPIIAGNTERNLKVCGTAFLIAEGWAMTAKHVVIDYLDSIGGVDFSRRGGVKGNFSFLIHMIVDDKKGVPVVLVVTRIYWSEVTDIALLRVQIQDGKAWESLGQFPVLQLLPPEIGDSVSVIGCPHSELRHTDDNIRQVHTYPRHSTGVVRDVHEMLRDRNLNFPCFHTSARVQGRMSGSPVFNSKGYICGVAVYSMEQDENHEPISYGAVLWPSAGIECDGEPPLADDSASFFDVMRRGHVKAIDLDQVLVARGPEGERHVINLPIAAREGWTPAGNVVLERPG